jgi:hypothetical protein
MAVAVTIMTDREQRLYTFLDPLAAGVPLGIFMKIAAWMRERKED